jgi:uncharacterized damage-inducible protein DinB
VAIMDLTVTPGLHPVVAHILAGVDFGRTRLSGTIKDLSPEQLIQAPVGFPNSIATLVVHIASTEVRLAHSLNGEPLPDDLAEEFLRNQPQNPLPQAKGETIESLQAKLTKSRSILLGALSRLSDPDLTREIVFNPDRSVTVRWILVLLTNHQMLHLGHIQMIRKLV